jgi:Holliday junction resolvase RusA-like endonuclease
MKKTIQFTIKGNPEDLEGNPVPYVRVVGRALWLPHAKKYHAWKEYVRSIFYRNNPEFSSEKEQPLTTKISERARMSITIFWVNGVHADPDNVFKGLADALFANDKFLDGAFESHYASDGKGRVEVEITLNHRSQ